jgi:hypothetical protein
MRLPGESNGADMEFDEAVGRVEVVNFEAPADDE